VHQNVLVFFKGSQVNLVESGVADNLNRVVSLEFAKQSATKKRKAAVAEAAHEEQLQRRNKQQKLQANDTNPATRKLKQVRAVEVTHDGDGDDDDDEEELFIRNDDVTAALVVDEVEQFEGAAEAYEREMEEDYSDAEGELEEREDDDGEEEEERNVVYDDENDDE
jgi:hypothetical protein